MPHDANTDMPYASQEPLYNPYVYLSISIVAEHYNWEGHITHLYDAEISIFYRSHVFIDIHALVLVNQLYSCRLMPI